MLQGHQVVLQGQSSSVTGTVLQGQSGSVTGAVR